MDAITFGFVTIGGTTLLSVIGLIIVRKLVHLESLKKHHEVAGYFISVIGTLYAVLLGFIVVDSMTQLQETRVLVSQEANAVSNIFQVSQGLPEPIKNKIRKACLVYCDTVVNDEWPAMQQGKYSNKAFGTMYELWKTIGTYEPQSSGDSNVHAELLDQVSKVGDNRRARLVASRHGVPALLWCVLLVGGIFTILFTYFFGVDNLKVQVTMTVLIASILSLNVYIVYCYGYPYTGEISVGPDAFKLDRMIWNQFVEKPFKQKDTDTLPF